MGFDCFSIDGNFGVPFCGGVSCCQYQKEQANTQRDTRNIVSPGDSVTY